MTFWNKLKKSNERVSLQSIEPLHEGQSYNSTYMLSEFESKDLTYKKRIRVLRFISRFISLILNSIMMGTMSFSLAKYFTTKNSKAGDTTAWNSNTVLWPSIMVLSVATFTFFLNLGTLISYCWGSVKTANKISSVATYFGYAFMVSHVIAWVAVAGIYRLARTGRDLWGYTCSERADAVQEEVKSFLDFGKLCTMQQQTWFVTIIEAAFYLLTFIITIFIVRRAATKKKIGKIRESLSMQTDYAHSGGHGHEMGGFQPMHGQKYMPLDG